MGKKIVVVSSIVHIALALVIYITIAYQLSANKLLMDILANTDVKATLLRMSLYVLPGLYLLGGLFGLVFNTKPLLVFMGLLMAFSSIFMLNISYTNGFMRFIAIFTLIFAITYILGTIISKKED